MIAAKIKRFLQHRFPRAFSFVQARLSPEGLFGLHLTIGTVVFAGATWLFGGITEDLITGDPLILVDELISEWFRSHATPRFAMGMHFASALASTPAVSIQFAIMTIALVFLVALSRMYLGAHYLSDVLGAMAAGMAWLALCLTTVETLRRHRA